jgi:hypothetical protein
MKTVLAGLFAFTLVLAIAAMPAEAAQNKSKEPKESPKVGEEFSDTGTVTKNEIDLCNVVGLRYRLHPKSGEEVRLYPKSKHDSMILDQAVKDQSTVRVTGTWKQAVECYYVETTKVEKLKQ